MAKAREKKRPAAYAGLAAAILFLLAVAAAYGAGLISLTPQRYAVAAGEVAQQDIRANRDIDDEAATELQRQSAMNAVQPTYRIDGEKVQMLEAAAVAFFDDLAAVRAAAADIAPPDAAADWQALLTDAHVARLGGLTTPKLDKEALIGVLSSQESELNSLRDMMVLPKLTTALSGGLAESGIERVREAAVSEVRASAGLSAGLKRLGELALTEYLQPTYTVDEAATQAARAQAAATVETVQIQRGDVIVRAGTAITAEQMALLQAMDMVQGEQTDARMRLGLLLYVLAAYGLFAATLYFTQPTLLQDGKRMVILGLLLIALPFLALVCNMLDNHITPFPFAIMLIAVLVGERAALSAAVLFGALAGMLASRPNDAFGFDAISLLLFVLAFGLASTFALRRVQTRGSIIAAAGVGAVAGLLALFGLYMAREAPWSALLMDGGWGILSAILSGLLVVGSLSIWENLFDIATPARLNELLNTNHPLLKQLMYEAPGTYQHSMNVAALAESAAERVGADPLLARVGAYYHDVGKLRRPLYFMENQQGTNIHDTLPPEESASIIIAHQKDGATILTKHKMPSAVVRIAAEHHGNSLMAYFLYKAQQAAEGGQVDAKKFRYPGNRPGTREGAIILLADCCEAAVRSLGECTKEAREEMVHKVIWSKLTDNAENLLSNAPLTFQEISEIEKSFLRTFGGIMHDRIEYPEDKKG